MQTADAWLWDNLSWLRCRILPTSLEAHVCSAREDRCLRAVRCGACPCLVHVCVHSHRIEPANSIHRMRSGKDPAAAMSGDKGAHEWWTPAISFPRATDRLYSGFSNRGGADRSGLASLLDDPPSEVSTERFHRSRHLVDGLPNTSVNRPESPILISHTVAFITELLCECDYFLIWIESIEPIPLPSS